MTATQQAGKEVRETKDINSLLREFVCMTFLHAEHLEFETLAFPHFWTTILTGQGNI